MFLRFFRHSLVRRDFISPTVSTSTETCQSVWDTQNQELVNYVSVSSRNHKSFKYTSDVMYTTWRSLLHLNVHTLYTLGGEPQPGQKPKPASSVFPEGVGSGLPTWVAFDRQVLQFYAYFQEGVEEKREEQYRIRRCTIFFYLEDDSIQVNEQCVGNSGIPQGQSTRHMLCTLPVYDCNVHMLCRLWMNVYTGTVTTLLH